ncbi:hypothetical protein MASR1M48_16600 [Lactococcus petauri]
MTEKTKSYSETKKQEDKSEKARRKFISEILPKHLALLEEYKIPYKILTRTHYRIKIQKESSVYMVEFFPMLNSWKVPRTKAQGRGIPTMLRYFRIMPCRSKNWTKKA